MLRRIRDLFSDVARQADLVLLALCSATSLFGILMIYSATRYMHTSRLVLVQAASLVIGVVLYLLMSQIDLNELVKYWKWIFLLGFGFVLLLATHRGRHGQQGVAGVPVPARQGAARGNRQGYVYHRAGQAAGVAEGAP